jgi:hypothetical protein
MMYRAIFTTEHANCTTALFEFFEHLLRKCRKVGYINKGAKR